MPGLGGLNAPPINTPAGVVTPPGVQPGVSGAIVRALEVLVGVAPNVQIEIVNIGGVGTILFIYNNAGFKDAEIVGGGLAGGSVGLDVIGPASTAAGFTDLCYDEWNSSNGSSTFANRQMLYQDITGTSHGYVAFDGSGVYVTTGNISGIAPGTGTDQANPAIRATWQSLSLSNASPSGNNIDGFYYRMLGEADEGRNQFVYMVWDITPSHASPVQIGTLASGYAPNDQVTFASGWYGTGPAAYSDTFAPRLMVDTSGNVTMQGGVLATGMNLCGFAMFPLGSP